MNSACGECSCPWRPRAAAGELARPLPREAAVRERVRIRSLIQEDKKTRQRLGRGGTVRSNLVLALFSRESHRITRFYPPLKPKPPRPPPCTQYCQSIYNLSIYCTSKETNFIVMHSVLQYSSTVPGPGTVQYCTTVCEQQQNFMIISNLSLTTGYVTVLCVLFCLASSSLLNK